MKTRRFSIVCDPWVRSGLAGFLIVLGSFAGQREERADDGTSRLHRHYLLHSKSEQYVFTEVNRLRTDRGLRPLIRNAKLQKAARQHSYDMASLGYFGHVDLAGRNLEQRLLPFRVSWKRIAENVAKCLGPDPGQMAMEGWLQSKGHKRNIFDPDFSETGIGAYIGPDEEVTFCQIFLGR